MVAILEEDSFVSKHRAIPPKLRLKVGETTRVVGEFS